MISRQNIGKMSLHSRKGSCIWGGKSSIFFQETSSLTTLEVIEANRHRTKDPALAAACARTEAAWVPGESRTKDANVRIDEEIKNQLHNIA